MQDRAVRGGAEEQGHQCYAASCSHASRAFNSTAARFEAERVNANPGPGQYPAPPSVDLKSDSIGRKGYGPMASSTKRLVSRVVYSGPGPGAYRPVGHFEQREDFNHAGATAVFRTPATRKQDTGVTDSSPGPGAHSTATTRTGERLDWAPASTKGFGASSAFKCTARKGPGRCASADGPSPTTYNVTKPWLNRTMSDMAVGRRCRHSSQPDDSSRMLHGAGIGAAAAAGGGGSTARARGLPLQSTQLSNAMGARLLRSGHRPGTVPAATAPAAAAAGLRDLPPEHSSSNQQHAYDRLGPGAYELQYDANSIKARLQHDAGRASSMFRPPTQIEHGSLLSRRLDANGVPVPHTSAANGASRKLQADAVPGPGSYFDMQKCSTVGQPGSMAVTSAFKSSPGHAGPEQSGAHMGRAPGPAWYTAQLPPPQRSHRHPVAAVQRLFV